MSSPSNKIISPIKYYKDDKELKRKKTLMILPQLCSSEFGKFQSMSITDSPEFKQQDNKISPHLMKSNRSKQLQSSGVEDLIRAYSQRIDTQISFEQYVRTKVKQIVVKNFNNFQIALEERQGKTSPAFFPYRGEEIIRKSVSLTKKRAFDILRLKRSTKSQSQINIIESPRKSERKEIIQGDKISKALQQYFQIQNPITFNDYKEKVKKSPQYKPQSPSRQICLQSPEKSLMLKNFKIKIKTQSQSENVLKQKTHKSLFEKLGGEKLLYEYTEKIFEEIMQNDLLNSYLQGAILSHIKQGFLQLLHHITGDNKFYMLETLFLKHKKLKVTKKQFNEFKLIMQKVFLQMFPDKSLFFEISPLIEQCRYFIVEPKVKKQQLDNHLPLYSYIHQNPQLDMLFLSNRKTKLAQIFMEKVMGDIVLNRFFAQKSEALIFHLMQHVVKILTTYNGSYNLNLQKFRTIHKMEIRTIHYVLFKNYMLLSLKELSFSTKEIENCAQRIEGFRSSIENKDSFQDKIIQYPGGESKFFQRYFNSLLNDVTMHKFNENYGKQNIMNHVEYIYHYMTKQHYGLISKYDIINLHKHIDVHNPTIKGAFISFEFHFMRLAQVLNLEPEMQENFHKMWQKLAKCFHPERVIKSQLTEEQVKTLKTTLIEKFEENRQTQHPIYKQQHILEGIIDRVINYLFHNDKQYTKDDLKMIHERINIPKSAFDWFVQLLNQSMVQLNINQNVINLTIQQMESIKEVIAKETIESQFSSIL